MKYDVARIIGFACRHVIVMWQRKMSAHDACHRSCWRASMGDLLPGALVMISATFDIPMRAMPHEATITAAIAAINDYAHFKNDN